MRTLEKILDRLDGKLLSIERNTELGSYELKIGLPATWVYKKTDFVELDEIHKSDKGVLLKIYSTDDAVCIDDLIDYINVIIDTNEKIAAKEDEYNRLMQERKKQLEDEFSKYEEEIEELREKSFKSMSAEDEEKSKKKKHTNNKKSEKKEKDLELVKADVEKQNSLEELEKKLSD